MNYDKYNDIRPLLSNEVAEAIEQLIAEPMLKKAFDIFQTGMAWDELTALLRSCKSVADFKIKISYTLVKQIMKMSCQSVDFTMSTELSKEKAYTYISNHRDIILDSAFLNVMLFEQGYTFPEIAIGDNLLIFDWVETLVKLNGSFLVKRNLQGREVLMAAKQLSEYMNEAIADNIPLWIAQREGRAKDSSDHTQPALLKMLTLGAERGTDFLTAIRKLNIVPTACSYEFDPCDYLKAKEMQLKRDTDYKKSPADDGLNMQTGVMGNKGRVHFTTGRPLNEILDEQDLSTLKGAELIEQVAKLIDKEIYRSYKLFPYNYVALNLIENQVGDKKYRAYYSDSDYDNFLSYITSKINDIKLPEGVKKDKQFLFNRLVEMYANPAKNQLAVLQQ